MAPDPSLLYLSLIQRQRGWHECVGGGGRGFREIFVTFLGMQKTVGSLKWYIEYFEVY